MGIRFKSGTNFLPIMIFGGIGIIVLIGLSIARYFGYFKTEKHAPPPPKGPEVYDVDAMAARFGPRFDFYQSAKNEMEAFYHDRHQTPSDADQYADMVISLGAYYATMGDPFGEGALRDLVRYKQTCDARGLQDPLLFDLQTSAWYETNLSPAEPDCIRVENEMLNASQTEIPTQIKLWEVTVAINNCIKRNRDSGTLAKNSGSMALLPQLIDLWGKDVAQLLKERPGTKLIYTYADHLYNQCQSDPAVLTQIHDYIDKAYASAGLDDSIHAALEGDYRIGLAWAARGNGYANTVSATGAQEMQNQLAQAQQVLQAASAKYPDQDLIPTLMITVCLLESGPKTDMEAWYQRAISISPNDPDPYQRKMNFLQPRWFGTDEEVWQYCCSCVDLNKWDTTIPMVLPEALFMVKENGNPDIFKSDAVWPKLEPTFREFLRRHPRSDKWRTAFLEAAYFSDQKAVAAEQCKLLGPNWDSTVISKDQYGIISNYVR